jgi:hypothetical protein
MTDWRRGNLKRLDEYNKVLCRQVVDCEAAIQKVYHAGNTCQRCLVESLIAHLQTRIAERDIVHQGPSNDEGD